MSNVTLSEGVLANIMLGGQVANPVVQVLGCRKIPGSEGAPDRYRLVLSDGKYMITFAMLTAQLNEKVSAGQLSTNSVITIRRYITTKIQSANKTEDRRILVLLEIDELANGVEMEKIGTPENLTFDQLAALRSSNTRPEDAGKPSVAAAVTPNRPQANSASTSNRTTTQADTSMDFSKKMWNAIETLNPYNTKWILKVRVTNKAPIRTWSNSKGEGKLFSMSLCDETGEIRATAFNAEVDKFYEMIEADKVYYITGGQIKLANKQFNNLNNDYEITLSRDTQISECQDAEDDIPKLSFNFVPIASLTTLDPNTMVDIIAVCAEAGEPLQLISKAGKALVKRELMLVDQSNATITLTLWGTEAQEFDGSSEPVIAIKSAKLAEFMGGKSLSVGANSSLRVNPDIPEAHKLRGWYDSVGQKLVSNAATVNISTRSGGASSGITNAPLMTLEEAKVKQTETADGKLEFSCLATVVLIKSDNLVYKACSAQGCNKKVTEMGDDTYRCPKCDRLYEDFNYRLLMNMNIGDHATSLWATCFSQDAEKILGKTSKEIGEMIAEDEKSIQTYTASKNFQRYVFTCRSTMETYNDETRMRTVILSIDNYVTNSVCKYLINKISSLSGVELKN